MDSRIKCSESGMDPEDRGEFAMLPTGYHARLNPRNMESRDGDCIFESHGETPS